MNALGRRRIVMIMAFAIMLACYGRLLLALAATNLANIAMVHQTMQVQAGASAEACDATVLQAWPASVLRWSLAVDDAQPATYVALGRWALSAGCRDEATQWLSRAVDQPMAAYALGGLYEAAGNTPDAVRVYQRIPTVARAYVQAGRLAASVKNWPVARHKLEVAVRIAPDDPVAHYALGEDLLYNPPQDLDAGIGELQAAVRFGYPSAYVYSRIAHGYAMSGRYAQALGVLDSSQQADALANAVRGDAYLAQRDPARAVLAYQDSLRQEPNNPWVNTNLGQAYWERGDHALAVQAWRHTLEISPGFAPAISALHNVGQS